MIARKLMWIAWPAFLAACVLQVGVFALVDPLELAWSGHALGWSRQAVYAGGFLLFWLGAMLSSSITLLLGLPSAQPDSGALEPGALPERG